MRAEKEILKNHKGNIYVIVLEFKEYCDDIYGWEEYPAVSIFVQESDGSFKFLSSPVLFSSFVKNVCLSAVIFRRHPNVPKEVHNTAMSMISYLISKYGIQEWEISKHPCFS
ncbi:MAG: hypothetical protein Q6363_001990 [Candidatus Njordarchaeota archaeon]